MLFCLVVLVLNRSQKKVKLACFTARNGFLGSIITDLNMTVPNDNFFLDMCLNKYLLLLRSTGVH